MCRIDSLVSELFSDFVDPVEAPDYQHLEVQLWRDPKPMKKNIKRKIRKELSCLDNSINRTISNLTERVDEKTNN